MDKNLKQKIINMFLNPDLTAADVKELEILIDSICQSCLTEHDRELKEALEHRITICDKNLCKFSDSCKGFYGFRNCKIKDEFWKERGIE